ncbi:peptidase M23 [Sesbania bispinosa]|nr:peptidase M23 [Sesbania bispinosa]
MEAKAKTDKAKADLDTTKTGLDKALKEIEETKAKLLKFESEYGILNDKYENVVLKPRAEAYENTVQQLKILNPKLVIFGSDPCAYVIDGVIMKDSLRGPFPFVPRKEVIGDSDQVSVQGLGEKVEEPVPSSTQQQPSKEDSEVASKDATIHLD